MKAIERVDMLVEQASMSFKRVLSGRTNYYDEMRDLKLLVEKLSLENEKDYFELLNEPSGVDTRVRYFESSEMYKLIAEVFLYELQLTKKM